MMFRFLVATAILASEAPAPAARVSVGPDTVLVQSGTLQLHALLWKPRGRGPFPAILLNVGSGRNPQLGAEITVPNAPPFAAGAAEHIPLASPQVLGPLFARHGYEFLVLFRRGQGLSADQGRYAGDSLNRERTANGVAAANHLQVRLLETELLDDASAAVAYLRARRDVDPRRVGVVGHSFGGSLTLVLAARDSSLGAAVVFGAAGYSWSRSAELRARLLAAVGSTVVPTFFIHAANDFSVEPGQSMSARMDSLGVVHRLKIYPAYGRTPDEGHSLIYLDVAAWERDVFEFLDTHLRH